MSDKPRKESVVFFEDIIKRHSKVKKIKKVQDYIYEIQRMNSSKILVCLTNIYTVGIADYFDITNKHPEVNCIVTISNWNSYTRQAKEQANEDNIGIFVFQEFMGALNIDRQWEYVKKDNKGKPIRYWRG